MFEQKWMGVPSEKQQTGSGIKGIFSTILCAGFILMKMGGMLPDWSWWWLLFFLFLEALIFLFVVLSTVSFLAVIGLLLNKGK